ncbi:hypothetical protein V9T40_011026 [Parthenolecanium corni]|uniref:ZP domain-containing protein n=1 Tax=Parthenolecanium corni TaxID=536013 RepID=A0AAN9XZ60_9HEMI
MALGEEVDVVEAISSSSQSSSSDQNDQQNAVAQHREDTDRDNPDQVALESGPDQETSAKHGYNSPPGVRDIPLSLPSRSGPPLPPPYHPPPHIHGKPFSSHHPPPIIYHGHSIPHPPPPPSATVQKNVPEAMDKLYTPGNDAWPVAIADTPKIVNLDVKCEKNSMKVFIGFDKPFYGIVFSKGHYSNLHCVHLPAGLGRTSATFELSIHACGTTGNTENGLYGYGADSGSGTYFENIIVIQYDPQVQEVWDQARKLRCTWHDQYEKSVTFRPFPVDMLDVVRADFAGDNVGCWMQIQVGKGPWASEVSGLVKIGQTMTMVLAIKDDDSKFDMLVRNCMAHDGKRAPIQLVDQRGCVTRSKLMSRFTKIKNFGASASVLSYAHFQAFKFPDSMEVHFQCTIQICRYQCPEQCSDPTAILHSNHESILASHHGAVRPDAVYGPPLPPPLPLDVYLHGNSRRDERRVRKHKRDVSQAEKEEVGVNRIIKVVSTGDLTFAIDEAPSNGSASSTPTMVFPTERFEEHVSMICMTSFGFSATLVFLLTILFISCLISSVLCVRLRSNMTSKKIHPQTTKAAASTKNKSKSCFY